MCICQLIFVQYQNHVAVGVCVLRHLRLTLHFKFKPFAFSVFIRHVTISPVYVIFYCQYVFEQELSSPPRHAIMIDHRITLTNWVFSTIIFNVNVLSQLNLNYRINTPWGYYLNTNCNYIVSLYYLRSFQMKSKSVSGLIG